MTTRILLLASLSLLLCGCLAPLHSAQTQFADTVFTNGSIYTVDESNPITQAVAIRNGIIEYVGDDAGAQAFIGSGTEVIDLEGRMLMPGFQDPHLHAVEAGINESLCFLSQAGTANQYRNELASCAQQQSDSEWVLGSGVSMINLLDLGVSPIELINAAIPDRPALILDDLGHGAWANTLAIEAVGYDLIEGDPQGGIFIREVDGSLSGVFLENAQQKLRTASLMPTTANLEFTYQSFQNALTMLAQNGITTVSDAGGYWPRGHHEIWLRAERENTLTVRASNALYLFPDREFGEQIAELKQLFTNDPEVLVRFDQVKIYIDGILDIGTSALYESYDLDLQLFDNSQQGFLYFDVGTLNSYSSELAEFGFQLHFHATGDRGAGIALDAIEQSANSNTDLRHRITHLYLINERDRNRFVNLGVIADFQLASGSIDPFYASDIAELIGTRSNELLPARSILETDARVVLSSDWDADELSPLAKIQAVLSRQNEGIPDLETALKMTTLDVAFLLHHEDRTGSIEVGKLADLIVLDRNLFEIPKSQIGQSAVLLTMLGGEVVYQNPKF
jgi:hypothetical protein